MYICIYFCIYVLYICMYYICMYVSLLHRYRFVASLRLINAGTPRNFYISSLTKQCNINLIPYKTGQYYYGDIIPSQLHGWDILAGGKIQFSQILVLHIVEEVSVRSKRWSFAFKFEYNHSIVMAGRKQI